MRRCEAQNADAGAIQWFLGIMQFSGFCIVLDKKNVIDGPRMRQQFPVVSMGIKYHGWKRCILELFKSRFFIAG